MSFEQKLRDRINSTPYKNPDRDIMKVVLGEVQQLVTKVAKISDEMCYGVVRGLMKTNDENISLLKVDDVRRQKYVRVNEVLQTFLPTYWSTDQIKDGLAPIVEQLKATKEGPAIGMALKHLKGLDATVEGDVVKTVVQTIRA